MYDVVTHICICIRLFVGCFVVIALGAEYETRLLGYEADGL